MPFPKTESQVRQDVQRHIQGPHWTPVETYLTARGVPDLNGCLDGIEAWIEIKIITGRRFQRPFSPNQRTWIKRRVAVGGHCFLLASHRHNGGKLKGPPVDRLYLWSWELAKMPVSDSPLDHTELILWQSDGPRHDWIGLEKILFSA